MITKDKVISFVEKELEILDYNDDNFIYIVSTYLSSLEHKEPVLELMPKLKKSIKVLENKFDHNFLLVKSDSFDSLFLERHNWNLLNCLDSLCEILQTFNFHFEVEKLTHIKTKLQLGYERYFIQEKFGKLVEWFSPVDIEFEVYDDLNLEDETDVLRILNYLLDEEKFKEFKLFLPNLINFPSKIYRNSNIKLIDIQKSLFFDETFKVLEYSSGKIKTSDFESLDVAVKLLEILNNKKFK